MTEVNSWKARLQRSRFNNVLVNCALRSTSKILRVCIFSARKRALKGCNLTNLKRPAPPPWHHGCCASPRRFIIDSRVYYSGKPLLGFYPRPLPGLCMTARSLSRLESPTCVTEGHIDVSALHFRRKESLPSTDSHEVPRFQSLRKFACEQDKIILWYSRTTTIREKLGESRVAVNMCKIYS